eukprot:5471207-Pyramimonas_sp.AAC.1
MCVGHWRLRRGNGGGLGQAWAAAAHRGKVWLPRGVAGDVAMEQGAKPTARRARLDRGSAAMGC